MPMPPRPVDATLHGVVDYNAGAFLLTAFPRLAGIEGTGAARCPLDETGGHITMPIRSAGILLYKTGIDSPLEVWIAHMGGPFWSRKDAQAWSIPKGEYGDGEDPLVAALREFEEEIGQPAPAVPYERLGDFTQPSGKVVTAGSTRTSEVVATFEGASRVRGATIGGALDVRSPTPGNLEGSKMASYVSPRSRANLGRKRTRSSSTR